MRRRKGSLTSEEVRIWQHVARQARPMQGKMLEALPPEPAPAAPLPPEPLPEPQRRRTAAPALAPLTPFDRRARRHVARGQVEIDARIDLHGMRQAEAHRVLIDFVYRARHRGWKIGLVITGKGGGLDSRGEERGVLRRLVPHWLADPTLRPLVLGYEPASAAHGGEGALYLRFRRARSAQEP